MSRQRFQTSLELLQVPCRRLGETDKDDVKAIIESGAMNGEMFWLSRKCYQYLREHPTTTTRIFPRPPRVVKETDDLLQRTLPKSIMKFFIKWSDPAPTYSDSSPMGVITKLIEKKFKLNTSVCKVMIEQSGVEDTCWPYFE